MKENVIQTKSRIKINADVSVKVIVYVKKVIFWFLLHAAAKMVNISEIILTIQWSCVMELYKKQK